ncbi:MAG TPA: retropepsin-like aspartic protease [Anaerolineae bacterium]|nr:retropepsin-like aspartic protease [Anaerolineae bacterium]
MPEYDAARFEPPAPLAQVTLRNPASGATWPDALMLLDSGADVSLIPQAIIKSLRVETVPGRRYELIGFDGGTSFAAVVQLELSFARRTFRGQFLIIEQEWGILGRNILNAVPLLLDGPNLRWEEDGS